MELQGTKHLTECRQIIGCAMEVLNTLGHGLLEKPYEKALTVEFRLNGIPFEQQPRYEVNYKGHGVGYFIPDLIVHDCIVVDTKVVDRICNIERGQMLNYLKITDLDMGILLNFRYPRLQWRRVSL